MSLEYENYLPMHFSKCLPFSEPWIQPQESTNFKKNIQERSRNTHAAPTHTDISRIPSLIIKISHPPEYVSCIYGRVGGYL